MSNINYKPNLDYTKNYQTEGFIDEQNNVTTTTADTTKPAVKTVQDVRDGIEQLYSGLKILPYDIRTLIEIPLAGANFILSSIDENDYDPSIYIEDDKVVSFDDPYIKDPEPSPTEEPSPEPTPTSPYDDISPEDLTPPDIFSDIADPFDYTYEVVDPEIRLKKIYATDVVTIVDDYVNSLQTKVSVYINSLMGILHDTSASLVLLNKQYDGKAADVTDPNLKHLSDYINRSQITRDQKSRLIKRLYNLNKTIYQIRACNVAYELRKRYTTSSYIEVPNTLLDVNSNQLLDESNLLYEKKYKENFSNLYKYLNSSVILINECLQMHIKETQAKATLINRG